MTADKLKMLILATRLFPDRETVRQALSEAVTSGKAETIELKPNAMEEEDWDRVVERILRAEKIITI